MIGPKPPPKQLSALAGLQLVCMGCTVLSDFDVHQCSTTFDCELHAAALMHCERSVCVSGCENNDHCARHDPRAPLCRRPGEECSPLFDEAAGCTSAAGHENSALNVSTLQDIDVIGVFVPSVRSSTWLSARLATQDLNATLSAVGAPPLIALACSDSPSTVAPAISHLTDQLGSVGTLAPARGRALRAALGLTMSSSPYFLLSPGGSAVNSSDLLWHLGPDYASTLPVFQRMMSAAISAASARTTSADSLRMASIVGDDPEDSALAAAVHELLAVNGANVQALTLADRFREIPLYTPEPNTREVEHERLSSYAPDVVLLFIGARDAPGMLSASKLIESVEERSASRGSPPPLYILGPRLVDDTSLRRLAATHEPLRSRMIGVRADSLPELDALSALQLRFRNAFPEAERAGFGILPSVYDGMQTLLLAIAAARETGGTLDSRAVALGLSRITDPASDAIAMSPATDGTQSALLALRAGITVSLVGASGPIQMDPVKRTRDGTPRAYTFGRDGSLTDTGTAGVFEDAVNRD